MAAERRVVHALGVLALTGLLAGCGLFGSPAAGAHPSPSAHHHRHASGGSPSPSPASSSSSSVPSSSAPPASPSSSAPSSSSPSVVSSGPPPAPPNAGPFTDLKIESVTVTRDGTGTASGHSEPVLLVTLTILNPSSGIIALESNDFSVVPAGGPFQYSWNDYATTGLTAANSLFYPINPTTPTADPRYIQSGTRVTGAVTVEVPAAANYDIVWGSPTSGNIAASFSAP